MSRAVDISDSSQVAKRCPNQVDQQVDTVRAAMELADEREALSRRIREIEDFISSAPARMDKSNFDDAQTIMPPHARELYRHPVTGLTGERPLIRRQAAAQLATRRKNMVVFIISALLFSVFACWISQSL